MGIETLTDDMIAELLACPKRVENPQAREKVEGLYLWMLREQKRQEQGR